MKLLDTENNIVKTLNLGIVEAGTSKEFRYFVYNDTEAELIDIEVFIDHKEIIILRHPKRIFAGEKAELKIKWSPSLTLKKGLKTSIQINGSEIYG